MSEQNPQNPDTQEKDNTELPIIQPTPKSEDKPTESGCCGKCGG